MRMIVKYIPVAAVLAGMMLTLRSVTGKSAAADLEGRLSSLLATANADGSWSLAAWDDPTLGGWTGLHALGDVRARGLAPLVSSDLSLLVGVSPADVDHHAGREVRPGAVLLKVAPEGRHLRGRP